MHISEQIANVFSGLCRVEAAVEIEDRFLPSGEHERIRIEVLKDARTGEYSAAAYRQEHVKLQPEYPQSYGKYDQDPCVFRAWVDYELPFTQGKSADEVINSALDFLARRLAR